MLEILHNCNSKLYNLFIFPYFPINDNFIGYFSDNSMVSCQKGPTRHAYAWQIGPFWQDTLELCIELTEQILFH